MTESVAERMRSELRAAMKARDRVATVALRSALAAIANAEATKPADTPGISQSIERSPSGAGATEVARRQLTERDVATILQREIDERTAAAEDYVRHSQTERAEELRAEAAVLTPFVDPQ